MVAIWVEVALLPRQMTLEHRPHLPHILLVGIILEVPQQFIDVAEVHVVMVHLVGLAWRTADIAIAIHLAAPPLLGPGTMLLLVLQWMGRYRLHIGDLTLGIGIEMADGTVAPS